MEGKLNKYNQTSQKLGNSLLSTSDTLRGKATRIRERYVFLFDAVIVLCKPLPQKRSSGQEYRLKEQFPLRKIEVIDRDDTDDLSNAFEIRQKDNTVSVVLVAQLADDKTTWMATLVMLQTRSMLERMLDSCLEADQKRIPLLIPSPDLYRFAKPDSDENIVLEDYTSSSGIPVVRGATLMKLVERCTYHMYVDLKFVRTFLTTFRLFCTPRELLNLLIDRFNIPEPVFDGTSVVGYSPLGSGYSTDDGGTAFLWPPSTNLEPGGPTMDSDSFFRECMKRLRKEYIQPVQIRVLNVIRQWIDHHWYDFQQDPDLLLDLKLFLKHVEEVNKVVKWAKSLQNIIERKIETKEELKEFQFPSDPPLLEWHLTQSPEEFDLMTLHPVEIARQITLIEFDLYRAVKPIELVGAAWTKKDKDKRSPQLMKLIQHSTKVYNIGERVAVMNRIVEIMCVFEELNNFTGLFEIYGVLESSPVHRLYYTWERLDQKLLKAFDEVKQILSDAHHKLIRERLRSINPPCVPFFGMYLTNIIFLEEGNPIFLKMPLSHQTSETDASDTETATLISFSKCRKIADIIGEIQMYQNQPYCLVVEPSIRVSFERYLLLFKSGHFVSHFSAPDIEIHKLNLICCIA
ncbi:unnamed protein product [Soboliphyme baturini]|uniref:Ras-GEF domain-containing protein n=1 Tax=Soboliphyme baturini TaxID=241478 RepID=A0A183J307_9BILA|nr:unnamed protein product [Soboliphyme baturini]